jgi:hypothetical protein
MMRPTKPLSGILASAEGTSLVPIFSLYFSAPIFLPVASCFFGSARAGLGFRPSDFAVNS